MRIIYPFVTEFPAALAALAREQVEKVDLSSDDEAYYRLLSDLWRSGDDFLLIEQDNVVPTGAIAALRACSKGWCGVPYYLYGGFGVWHGVTRYRAKFTAAHPAIPDLIQRRHWEALDSAWMNWLRREGAEDAHWHWPAGRHIHPEHGDESTWTTRYLNCKCGAAVPEPSLGRGICPNCGRAWILNVKEHTYADLGAW